MTVWGILDLAGTWLFAAGAVAIVVFVANYLTRSPWRATPEGRNTGYFMLVVASIMVLAVVFGRLLDHNEQLEDILRTVFYGLLFLTLVRLNVVLLRAQQYNRRGRRRRASSTGSPSTGSASEDQPRVEAPSVGEEPPEGSKR